MKLTYQDTQDLRDVLRKYEPDYLRLEAIIKILIEILENLEAKR